MVQAVIQPSFAAGEVAPSMYGRVDLAKYRVGLAMARNFMIDYRGGASNRPGTKYIQQAGRQDSIRLFKFRFNRDQQYVIEAGEGYFRFYRNGGQILSPNKTLILAPGSFGCVAHGYSVNEWVYLSIPWMPALDKQTFIIDSVPNPNNFVLRTLRGTLVNASLNIAGTGYVAAVYTLPTPYLAPDLHMLKFTQTEDIMTITHKNYQQRKLTRFGDNNWTLVPISFLSTIPAPENLQISATAFGTTGYSYVITAVSPSGEESLASDVLRITTVNIGTTAGTITITWGIVLGAAYYNVYKSNSTPGTDVPTGVQHGFIGSAYGTQFKDGNILPDYTKTPPTHDDPFATGTIDRIVPIVGGTGYTSTPTVVITDPTGVGAKFTAVRVSDFISGYIKENAGHGYTSPSVSIVGGGGSGASAVATLGPLSGTWPGICGTFQQRKIFGETANEPSTVWGSQTGLLDNFNKSVPVVDTDAYKFKLSSNEINSIKSMLAMPGGLVILTEGGAWQLSGGDPGSPITPVKVQANPQAFNGANDLPPIAVNYEILYVQTLGSSVRSLSYNFFANIYTGSDMSVLANHLFEGRTIVSWDYAEEPFKVIWAVRDDGKFLAFTFLKEQEVFAWARQDTIGEVKCICTIIEGGEHVTYFVVRRLINGAWVQYIERMSTRIFHYGADDAWFVDCGLERPLAYPNVGMQPSTFEGVCDFVTDVPFYNPAHIGSVIRVGGGIAKITTLLTASVARGVLTRPIDDRLIDGTPKRAEVGQWSLTTEVTTVIGADHLEGKEVAILADGVVLPRQTVVNGSITLTTPASRIIFGLPIQAQLQSLPLDTGEPTTQGKRKKFSGLTTKVNATRGLKYGWSFDDLNEFRLEGYEDYPTDPNLLMSGEHHAINDPNWRALGQICYQQDDPLPASILAIIPDVSVGDDG